MKLLSIILVLLLFCPGCGYKAKQEYQGKPLRYWEWQAVNENPTNRIAAAKALGKFGPKRGLDWSVKLLSDNNNMVKFAADLAIREMGKTSVPYLQDLLHHPDKVVRTNATKALIQTLMDMRSKGAIQLAELLRNPDPNVRESAAKALIMAGSEAASAIEALKEAQKKENSLRVQKAIKMTLQVLKSQRSSSKKTPPVPFTSPPSE